MNEERVQEESRVERVALDASNFELLYPPVEKIKSILVDSFPSLGKFTALRFLEWAQRNPGGVISPTDRENPRTFYSMGHASAKNVESSRYAIASRERRD